MQKRVVGNINELNEASRKTASEKSANTAGTDRDGCKANKTSFGRFKKFAVIIMLLIVSVFCAIGSADWIISQQEQLPGGSGSTFVYDKKTLQNYIALKGSDETEAAAKVAEAEEYASLQTETDSDDSAVADKFTVKKAAVSKKSAVSTYANGLESAIYGKSAIYNGKPIVAIKKTAGIDNAVADLPSSVLNGSLLTSYKPLTDGSVTEADLTEAYFAEGATSGLPQNAGTYAILVKIKGLEVYGYAVKIFTILPCPVTVGWSGVDFANGFTYDGAAHPVTVAAKIASSDNGNIEGSEVNANLSVSITKNGAFAEEIKTAGDYTLAAASGNDNYVIYDTESTRTTSFTVTPYGLNIKWSDTPFTYTKTVQKPIATISNPIAGLAAPDVNVTTYSETGVAADAINAGSYTAKAIVTDGNYSIASGETANFTIKKKSVTIIVGKSVTYGDTATFSESDLTITGLIGNDTLGGNPTFASEYTAGSPVAEEGYALTVNKKSVAITIIGKKITYGDDKPETYSYTGDDGDGDVLIAIASQIEFACSYEKGYHAGDYEVTAKCNNDNYTLNVNTGTLKVNKARLTLVANVNSITYGEAPSANGYYYKGFLLNDNEQSANITGTVKYSFDYNQYNNIYDEDGNEKSYHITPSVENFSSTNYACSDIEKGTLTVNKLPVKATVEKTYNDSSKDTNGNYAGLHFNKDLFKDSFAPVNANITLPDEYKLKIYNDINDSSTAVAKNFTGKQDTSKAENGFFEYSFGDYIKAGSTYAITGLTLKNTSNYSLSDTVYVYLKYKTAKIGESFFTIEDALAKSGDITIIGDSTDSASYVITAFSKLGLDSSKDSAFSDYKSNYAYTLNGKLIVSFDGQNSTEYSHNKSAYSKGFVKSAFIIPSGVNLTLSSSSNLIIGAAVAFNQDVSTTVAMNRGVIMNNGQITAQNGSNISSYGYVKGTGNIIMQNGSKAVDALAIYDWPGGIAASSMYKNVFPSNAYTMHNISCKTVIYAGAIYSAKVYVYMSKLGIEKEVDVEQIIIGTQSEKEKGMFNLTNNSDKGKTDTYIIKSVTTYNGEINSSITSTNQRIKEGSDQYLNHRDKIEIYGNYSDDSLKITVEALGVKATLENNTSKPLPVGFMDVYVCRGTMNLTKSDYLILPGACIKVENGGTLNLGSNVDIIAMPYSSMPTGGRGYFNYYTSSTDGSGKQDGKLIVNGTLTGNDYNLGGKIVTESANSTLTVVNASGSYVTMISTASPYYKSGTSRATGNIITDRSNYGEANFSTGTYYSKNVGTADSPVYAWFKNTATVTYVLNGGTLNGSQENHVETVTLTANGYTDKPVPSKPYYTFGGWFFDSDLSETATSVYTSCTLYAKWNPIEYTVKYHFASIEYGTLNDEKLSGNEIKALSNPPKEQLTINGTTLTFAGWYLTSDYSGNSVSSVSAANADSFKIINVYANFINADTTYNVFFELNPEGITDNTVGMIALDFDKKSVHKGEATEISSLVDILSIYNYNTDYKSNYYFSGWYLSTDETQTVITVLPSTISEDLTLFAKWEKKNSVTVRSSIEVSLKTSDGQTEVAIGTGEEKLLYLYKGATLSLEDKKELHKNGFNSTKTVYTEHSLILSETENGTNAAPYSITSDITLYIRCDEVTYHQVDITVRLGEKNWIGMKPKAASVTINSSSHYDINGEKQNGNITLENSTQKAGDEKHLSVYLPIGTYTPSGSNTASITPPNFTITKDTTTVTTVLAQGKDR